MEKSSKKSFKRIHIAYLLNYLYYVSFMFSTEQYEIYVKATHLYFSHFPGASLTVDEFETFSALYSLASLYKSFLDSFKLERLDYIIDNYFVSAENGR